MSSTLTWACSAADFTSSSLAASTPSVTRMPILRPAKVPGPLARQLRMGLAHVKRWIDDLMPLVTDGSDPLGVQTFATHHLPLEQAPHGYEIFRNKDDGCIKVVLQP